MDLAALKEVNERAMSAQWIGDFPALPGVEFLVLPISSPLVIREWARRQRKAPRSAYDDDGELRDEVQDEIDVDIYAEVILQGWRGIEETEGVPLEHSAKQARELMAIPVVEQAVRTAALRAAQEIQTVQKAVAGN